MIEHGPDVELTGANRRRFLQVMGASLALTTSGCRPQPKETIVPYVRSPEETVPGRPKYFATSLTLCGYATGVLVESHLGRPTKIEGNPDHPASRGAVDAFSQSAVLGLYDPDRAQAIGHRGEVQTWDAFAAAVQRLLEQEKSNRGAGIRVLTESISSPTLIAQLNDFLAQYPLARWYQYEPINNDNVVAGAVQAFGQPLDVYYRFEQARVVLAIEADFLASGPGHLIYARDFMAGRDPLAWDPVSSPADTALRAAIPREPNRLFAIESMPSCTGTVADHRLAPRPSEIEAAVRYLAAQLIPGAPDNAAADLPAYIARWLDTVAGNLREAGASSAVVIGSSLSAQAHALVHGINAALGNIGTVVMLRPPISNNNQPHVSAIRELVGEMEAKSVRLLLMLGGNPVFTAPADLKFAERLSHVHASVYLGLYEDETAVRCDWHIPAAHELETWSDARAFDATASIIQPLIAPLYEGKSPHELAALLLGNAEASSYELVRSHWRAEWGEQQFEEYWYQALHNGVIESPVASEEGRRDESSPDGGIRDDLLAGLQEAADSAPLPIPTQSIEISIRPDPTIHDGRFANNGWLQELPKPITKLTWDNAALLSTATAGQLQVNPGDVIRIHTAAGQVELPVWIVDGHADGCVTVHLGYGRTRGGSVAKGAGSNVYSIRGSTAMWSVAATRIEKTGRKSQLACTQHHQRMEHTYPAHWMSLAEYRSQHRDHSAEHEHAHPSLYEPESRPSDDIDYAWGMSINLNNCIGCGACVVACQAENNIPVVGKEMVLRNREMHWLRIDTYVDQRADGDNIILHQPVACVHCENAPCEVVCPVGATVHSAEGLNEMVYNRCVGTRYCSHNCPYKVRRFNFFNYTDEYSPTLQLLQNPDVTVRMRGVMEKCTYCVQRINAARVAAKKEDRRIADGDVITSCQAACPTRAIQFGDIGNQASIVAQQKQHPLDYGLLEELNTRPRTTYLARVTNPHPQLTPGTEPANRS